VGFLSFQEDKSMMLVPKSLGIVHWDHMEMVDMDLSVALAELLLHDIL
jgi:hypothetical protein